MKKIKALYLGIALLGAVGFTSCQADMDAPALVAPVATMEANTSILDLKSQFANQSVMCPMKDEASQTPYIIHGRVVSSDATGNIYKSIVLQDETAAITLSVNQGSTYTYYPIGQEVVLNVTGLYIGYYNGLQQIGWLGEPYDGETQLGFMAWDLFKGHSEKNGFPNPDVKYVAQNAEWPAANPYCIVTSFSQLPSAGAELLKMQSQLVEFRNVHFLEGGKDIYAPYQESVNRTLVDANGTELTVRTSGYSNFYNDTIPEGNGVVRGILSYYGDAYQLLLRGKGDVMITSKGQKDEPYTIAEAIEMQDQGASGWVSGYIVGSVKAGVTTVTSNNDVIFGKDAEMDNNILIAASADIKDYAQCVAVELPQGSAFRASVNLVDNPGVIGKAILVTGNLTTYLGMPGLTGNGGTASDVEVDGVTIQGGETPGPTPGGDEIPAGAGTKESPYNANQVKGITSDMTDVWVEGYVVGYAADSKWDSAVFGNQETAGSTNYANATNMILSMVPVGGANANNSIPCGLKKVGDVRDKLGISKNPAIYGARVKVMGNLTQYFGMRAIKEVSEYVILSEGGGDDPTPPTPGDETTIYSSLSQSAADLPTGWTISTVSKDPALSYVWSWKTYNGSSYLNGSANLGGTAYAADAYCTSPAISLTGYKTATLTFDHCAKFQTDIANICKVVVREVGQTAWSTLTIPSWPPSGAWTWANCGNIDLSAYAGKNIEIGFWYKSTSAAADTWEIRDLKITGTK